MRVKVSDWIARFVVEQGIRYNFTVTGGGAIHLNMSLGHQEGLENIYVLHEQSAAIAAEGYYRVSNRMAMVCCTTGPGGTNTLTGVLGAWLDSIPMLIVSGQVRYAMTARASGVSVRAIGDQEFDITPMVAHMTKYSEMITELKMVKYHFQKALYLAQHGRPGPVWLDVPMDIQGGYVDTDDFVEFDPAKEAVEASTEITDAQIRKVLTHIQTSTRPVFYAGNGIHIANCVEVFREVSHKLGIPVVTAFDATDLIPTDDPLYIGQPGMLGDRPGNWAVQNADLILSVGCRLSCRQVGYNVRSWAREAFVIMVDIDSAELRKPTIHVELPIQADAGDFLNCLNEHLQGGGPVNCGDKGEWLKRCQSWKADYPVVQKLHYTSKGLANIYCFLDELSHELPKDQLIVLGNGSPQACIHAIYIKNHTRLISNSGASSMGYDLPAAIGACFAAGGATTVCLTGDGSIQMNLQELQTIVFHHLPIKIFVINNGGYHSIRQTEGNLFPELSTVGIGPDSGDLSFPEMSRIAQAYCIPYCSARNNDEISQAINQTMSIKDYAMCEIFVNADQKFEPKSATKRLDDGTLISPPLEDLSPFLPREELERNMIIPLWKEE